MIYIAIVAFLYVSVITYGALVKATPVNDPCNFEAHPHEEVVEIDASKNPIAWWFKATFGK